MDRNPDGTPRDYEVWTSRAVVTILAVATVAACAMFGCAPSSDEAPQAPFTSLGHGVYRQVDAEAGMVCYVYASSGISCVPLAQTRLGGR